MRVTSAMSTAIQGSRTILSMCDNTRDARMNERVERMTGKRKTIVFNGYGIMFGMPFSIETPRNRVVFYDFACGVERRLNIYMDITVYSMDFDERSSFMVGIDRTNGAFTNVLTVMERNPTRTDGTHFIYADVRLVDVGWTASILPKLHVCRVDGRRTVFLYANGCERVVAVTVNDVALPAEVGADYDFSIEHMNMARVDLQTSDSNLTVFVRADTTQG